MFLTKGTETNYLIFMSKPYIVNIQNKWETFKYFQASESPWFFILTQTMVCDPECVVTNHPSEFY